MRHYSKQGPRTQKASNMGETAFHNVSSDSQDLYTQMEP